MNWDIIEWRWEQAKWVIKKHFAEFTDDEIAAMKADGEILKGKLQEKYGYTKDEADEKAEEIQKEIEKMDS